MPASALNFDAPLMMLISAAGGVAIVALAWWRRPPLGRKPIALGLIGLGLLTLAAGQPVWHRSAPGEIVVMVDVSPSTRTARFRDPVWLGQRIRSLLGDVPHRLVLFADVNVSLDALPAALDEITTATTRFDPPSADAIVLFSDGRFDPPSYSPPVWAVIDPALEEVDDAAITALRLENGQVVAELRAGLSPRRLEWLGVQGPGVEALAPGQGLAVRKISPDATRVRARLLPPDDWPENDSLELAVARLDEQPPWWIGSSPPSGWRALEVADLPTESSAYLQPPVIVLKDVAASDLSPVQQLRLRQYVQDLGGSLMILGAERAFGAGGYAASVLEAISPLASHPPQPVRHWIVLLDSSGSMAAPLPQGTLWGHATGALRAVMAQLPPGDVASVAGFARQTDWWLQMRQVDQVDLTNLPPARVRPTGPTNLEPALLAALQAPGNGLPLELVVLTDADVEFPRLDLLRARLAQTGARLHLLALDQGRGLGILTELARASGGQWLGEADPQRWTEAADELLAAATRPRTQESAVTVEFTGALEGRDAAEVAPWIQTWLKPGAQLLARSAGNDAIALGALWNLGIGRVLALSFEPRPAILDAALGLSGRTPRDPRFTVSILPWQPLEVAVRALEGDVPVNRLQLTMSLHSMDEPARVHPIDQIAPGEYASAVPAPPGPTLARVLLEGVEIAREPLAGRYPPEFERIGNDRDALEDLVKRWGGEVIEPGRGALDLRLGRRAVMLQPWLAATAAVFIGWALVVMRRDGR